MGAVGRLEGRSAIQRGHDGLEPPRADTQVLHQRQEEACMLWQWVCGSE